jgi:hypothetical protein
MYVNAGLGLSRAHGHHELCLKLIGTTYFVPSLIINTQITMSTNSYIASLPCNITGRYHDVFHYYSILKVIDLFTSRGLVARVVASTRATRHHKIKRWRVKCAFADVDGKADNIRLMAGLTYLKGECSRMIHQSRISRESSRYIVALLSQEGMYCTISFNYNGL